MADFPVVLTEAVDNTTDVLAKHINNLEAKVGIDNSAVVTSQDYFLRTGWINPGETWEYASSSTFTISGDVTAKYPVGTKIRCVNNSTKYFCVTAASYGAPNTTLTVTGGTNYILADAAISDNFYSYAEVPQGFPQWFDYTPSYAALGEMTYTSVTTVIARFKMTGKTVSVMLFFTGTTGGTASNAITFTLPVNFMTTSGNRLGCSAVVYDGGLKAGFALNSNATTVAVYKYDATNWALAAGKEVNILFTYETA